MRSVTCNNCHVIVNLAIIYFWCPSVRPSAVCLSFPPAYLPWLPTRARSSMRLVSWSLRAQARAQAQIRARTARYNENLQSRTRTTLRPEKICGFLKIFGPLKFLESDALVDNLNVRPGTNGRLTYASSRKVKVQRRTPSLVDRSHVTTPAQRSLVHVLAYKQRPLPRRLCESWFLSLRKHFPAVCDVIVNRRGLPREQDVSFSCRTRRRIWQ